MAKAIEQLQRRLTNERARHSKYRDRQRDAGKKQVNIWLSHAEITALRKIQESAGGVSQNEAVAIAVLKAAQSLDNAP